MVRLLGRYAQGLVRLPNRRTQRMELDKVELLTARNYGDGRARDHPAIGRTWFGVNLPYTVQ